MYQSVQVLTIPTLVKYVTTKRIMPNNPCLTISWVADSSSEFDDPNHSRNLVDNAGFSDFAVFSNSFSGFVVAGSSDIAGSPGSVDKRACDGCMNHAEINV